MLFGWLKNRKTGYQAAPSPPRSMVGSVIAGPEAPVLSPAPANGSVNGSANGHTKAAEFVPGPAVPAETPNFTLLPTNGRLIVERLEKEGKSRGGIILPDQAKEQSCLVRVLAACPEWYEDGLRRKSCFHVGDYLLISKYAGEPFRLDHGALEVTLVREIDVMAHIQVKAHATRTPDATAMPQDRPAVEIGGDGLTENQTYDTIPT